VFLDGRLYSKTFCTYSIPACKSQHYHQNRWKRGIVCWTWGELKFLCQFSQRKYLGNWYEHILRMTTDRLPKILLSYKPKGHWSIGRPQHDGRRYSLQVGNGSMACILEEEKQEVE
jgi:hypothetical protein